MSATDAPDKRERALVLEELSVSERERLMARLLIMAERLDR
jgi:hypothetical protein